MKKLGFFYFFTLIFIIGCGTSNKDKLTFLDKLVTYSQMRNDYSTQISGSLDPQKYENLQSDLLINLHSLETFKDWSDSDSLKKRLVEILREDVETSKLYVKSISDGSFVQLQRRFADLQMQVTNDKFQIYLNTLLAEKRKIEISEK